jgi:hypothetical protein
MMDDRLDGILALGCRIGITFEEGIERQLLGQYDRILENKENNKLFVLAFGYQRVVGCQSCRPHSYLVLLKGHFLFYKDESFQV